jgi:hypothetical protein
MNQHPANFAFHAVNKMARSPLELLELESHTAWPSAVTSKTGLRVLYRVPYGAVKVPAFDPSPSYIYEWGDAEISRREAALRAKGRAS